MNMCPCLHACTPMHFYPPLWHPVCNPSRHGRVCVMWEAGVCHLVWLSRVDMCEWRQRREKLNWLWPLVSGVASPWVRWAILIEGRERSPAPLVHKPLYRIPHHVLMASWDCGGGVIQWQVWQRKRKLSFTQVDFFVGKRQLLGAVKMSIFSHNSLQIWSPRSDKRCQTVGL